MSRLSVERAETVGFSEIRPAAATYNDDKGDEIGGFPPSLEKQSTITKVTSRITKAITSSSAREIEPPPDGGFVAWTQTAMSFLIIFNTWGYIVSFGVFQTYYVNELGYEPSAVSWIGSVQIFMQFFIGTWAGRATDAGYLRFILIVGFSLQLIGIFITSISTKYYQFFLAQGVCTGMGDGLVFTPSLALLSTYFTTKRSLAMGVSSAGSGFGGMIFPTIVRQLLPKIGFAWTVRVLGFVVLATSTMAVTFTKTRLPPRKTGKVIEWKVFKELPFTLFTGGMFFNFWGLYFAFYYIGSYGRNIVGVSEADSQSLLLLMNGISIIGRLIPNIIADRFFGPLNTIIPFCFVSSLLIYSWTAIHTRSGLFGWAATYGLLVAGVQSLFPAVVSSLNITDLKMAGVRMGMFFTVVSFACLTGPPFGGFLIQNNGGDYLNAQAWAASSLMVGGLLMVAARLAGTGPVLFMRI